MQAFFDNMFTPARCVAAYRGETPVASGYLIPAGNIVFQRESLPCAMIYALAVLPEYKNLGFGTGIVSRLIENANSDGCPVVVLCPSDDGLFDYYRKNTGFRDWFYINERHYKGLSPANPKNPLTEIDSREYSQLRESLLAETPHIESNLEAVAFQSVLCRETGGGLYRIDTKRGASCAVVERRPGGAVIIKELLSPGLHSSGQDEIAALSEIAAAFPADEYSVRTAARLSDPLMKNRRFGMLIAPDVFLDCHNGGDFAPWYGLAFD